MQRGGILPLMARLLLVVFSEAVGCAALRLAFSCLLRCRFWSLVRHLLPAEDFRTVNLTALDERICEDVCPAGQPPLVAVARATGPHIEVSAGADAGHRVFVLGGAAHYWLVERAWRALRGQRWRKVGFQLLWSCSVSLLILLEPL